jgi:ATP/maltotriose-dependent transcriptional regulator MalT
MLAGYSVGDRLARLDAAADDPHTPGGRMLLAVLAFEAIRTARPAAEAAMLAERALGAGADREPVADSPPRYLGLLALLYAERYEQVSDRCAAELAAVRKRGSVSGFATVSLVLADLAYRRGRLTDAESHAQAVLALEGIESPIFHGVALGTLVVCMLERGAHDTAAVTLTAAGVDALAPELLLHSLLLARGELKVARGDARAGLDDIESCGRLLQAAGHHNSASVPWRPAAAMVHAALGARAESERLVDEELRHARAFGAPRVLGIALRVASLVHGGQAGLALLEEAVSVLASSPAQLEYARALTDLGAARRRSGHRVDAREPLRHAIEVAHECDATVLAARAREELIAAGARPRRVARSGIRSLTPSERRVAELASRGLGNPGIAQALFVTVKTVETHLGHVYTKLGINTREALPKKLADAVPAPSTSDHMPSRHRRA